MLEPYFILRTSLHSSMARFFSKLRVRRGYCFWEKNGADIVFPIPLHNFPLTLSETINKSSGHHLQNKHACVCMLGYVQLFVTPWTVAHQAPLSMGFSRQESRSPGDLPDPGVEPGSLMSPALAGGFFTTSATWVAQEDSKGQRKQWPKILELKCSGDFFVFSFCLTYARLRAGEDSKPEMLKHMNKKNKNMFHKKNLVSVSKGAEKWQQRAFLHNKHSTTEI